MILVPIRTVPGLNAREHHMARAKRVRSEKDVTGWMLLGELKPSIPCSVQITRVCPGNLRTDDDNLVGALKSIRDAVAEWLGVDDKHSNIVRYVYAQRRGKWSVEIEFGKLMKGEALDKLGAIK